MRVCDRVRVGGANAHTRVCSRQHACYACVRRQVGHILGGKGHQYASEAGIWPVAIIRRRRMISSPEGRICPPPLGSFPLRGKAVGLPGGAVAPFPPPGGRELVVSPFGGVPPPSGEGLPYGEALRAYGP